jgi:WD40 repeat protein
MLAQAGTSSGTTQETDHWDLGVIATDADLSPDDRLIAVTSEVPIAPQRAAQIVESLEVWDYRQHKKIAGAGLATYVWTEKGKNPVRFTADGLLLAAADSTKVHLFETASLRSIRVIEPPLSQGFRIRALETSPIGHVAVIVTRRERIRTCMLFAYDLDTGASLFDWKPPDWVCPISIAWKPDGTEFAVAATDPAIKSDRLHIFTTDPWAHVRVLSGEIPPFLAFSNDHIYAVGGSLFGKGSVFKRHLGMTVFDVHGWKRQKKIFLANKDIHDSVSFANGRLLADTGTVKTDFDWSDAVGYAFATDAEITIWEGEARSIIFTSPPLQIEKPHNREVRLRLSRTGRMVLFNPQNPQVFQIP